MHFSFYSLMPPLLLLIHKNVYLLQIKMFNILRNYTFNTICHLLFPYLFYLFKTKNQPFVMTQV